MAAENATPAESFFLSYSRADERFALRFAKDLRARGVAIWVDQLDIRPSEHWDRAIEQAVRDCRGMVVIMSPRSAASDNVADEVSFALDSGKPVLPVMIERCTPPLRIVRMHMIDATASYDRALQQCLAEIARGTQPSGATSSRATPESRKALDPEVIAGAKRELTNVVGPIAGILVDKAASRASSAKELYSLLALHLDDEHDRAHFATRAHARRDSHPPAGAPKPPIDPPASADSTIAPQDVERVAAVLTTYLGPIAPLVCKRTSETAGSLQDLHERLAALIPSEHDRTEFLNRVEAR